VGNIGRFLSNEYVAGGVGGVLGFGMGGPAGAAAGAAGLTGLAAYGNTRSVEDAVARGAAMGVAAGSAAELGRGLSGVLNRGTFPDAVFSGKAPELSPGHRTLRGLYVNDRGQPEPWIAHYDQFGRMIARTDCTRGNKAAGIPPIHHHLYYWHQGRMYPAVSPVVPQGDHHPGMYRPW
jgi:hypothetical protein